MQGDIESVAAMSPKDLTAMFEVISGSDAYRKDYDDLETKKAAADDQLRFVFSKKKSLVAERKQKLEQKTEAEKHLKLQKELVGPAPFHFPPCNIVLVQGSVMMQVLVISHMSG